MQDVRGDKNITSSGIYSILPIRDILVFPKSVVPLYIGRKKSIIAVDEALENNRLIVLLTQKDISVEEPNINDLYDEGTLAEILQVLKVTNDNYKILIEGLYKVKLKEFLQHKPYFSGKFIKKPISKIEINKSVEALIRETLRLYEQYINLHPILNEEMLLYVEKYDSPEELVNFIMSHLTIKTEEKYRLFTKQHVDDVLYELTKLLNSEIEILKLESKIHLEVSKQIEKNQKDYYLYEKIKAIKKEMGQEGIGDLYDNYKKQLIETVLPKYVKEKLNEEIEKLQYLTPMSPELSVLRNYLDLVLSLPWDKSTKDNVDFKQAKKILDDDHYDLNKVKDKILDFLSVQKHTKKNNGTILCFIGPPGVGKTSLAKSIAKTMGRKFVRLSLGGLHDEAEIRGHRRTYVGSLPGKIIQSIKKVKVNNPLFLLDEVDKIQKSFHGDPASALLEVLDPEQNKTFIDNYLEFEFDLSNIFFITTANTTDTIPHALQDRMEKIELTGYIEEEKIQIAKHHLIPRNLKKLEVKRNEIKFYVNGLKKIIRGYTRESGVRNLEREIVNIIRKYIRKKLTVKKYQKPYKIDEKEVVKLLGPEKINDFDVNKNNRVGVATGLAWTRYGGDLIDIETNIMPGNGNLELTGKLGDVMKESARLAISYIRSWSDKYNIEKRFFRRHDIHIHVPEGAVPKDGPSAGITITMSVLSSVIKKSVRGDYAMTGEMTLTGKVLPVGGIKEKVITAHRNRIYNVILPIKNKNDILYIPKEIRNKLNFNFVENINEVIKLVLVE